MTLSKEEQLWANQLPGKIRSAKETIESLEGFIQEDEILLDRIESLVCRCDNGRCERCPKILEVQEKITKNNDQLLQVKNDLARWQRQQQRFAA